MVASADGPVRLGDPRPVDGRTIAAMPTPPRPVTAILDELATVERYLVDAPPHSGSGHREHLARRVAELRRELATARTSGPAAGETSAS